MTEPDVAAGVREGTHNVATYRLKLYAISFWANVAAGLYSFTIARILAEQNKNVSVAAWSGSAMMFGYGLAAYASGRLSDKIGRRLLLVSGGLLGAIVACIAPFVSYPSHHYALMGTLGIAAAMIFPTTIGALTADCPRKESHAVLFKFTVSWNAGLMAGTAAAGYLLGENRLQAVFAGVAVCMLAVSATGLLSKPPIMSQTATDEEQRDDLLSWPIRRRFAVAGWCGLAAATFIVGLVQFVFPSLATELGIKPELHGLMLAAYRFVSILVYIMLRLTAHWRYRLSWLVGAGLFGIATMLALASFSAVWLVFAIVVLCSVFPGILYFLAIYYGSNGFGQAERGKAGGIHETVIAAGFILGPLVSGPLGDMFGSTRVPFIAGACVIAASIVVQLTLIVPLSGQRRLTKV